jgi:hypothetical protein
VVPLKLNDEVHLKMKGEAVKPRVGIVSFGKRGHPRFSVDLPIEYNQVNSPIGHAGRAINASEGGLLVYLPEKMEIGQYLRLRFFSVSGTELNTTEMLTEVVWMDVHLGKNWGDYRSGVKFVEISTEDLNSLFSLAYLSKSLRLLRPVSSLVKEV